MSLLAVTAPLTLAPLSLAPPGVAPVRAAAHAPPCQSRPPQPPDAQTGPPPPPDAPAEAPWPLQRYADDRIAGLADGQGVTVAVIDSGVDASHPQLRGAVRAGDDLLDGADALVDCVGHGTAVASVIAARPIAGTEFRGLAPGSTILSMRVSEQVEVVEGATAGRRGTAAGLATAIRRAVDLGAGVINLSLVSYRDDPAVRDAVGFAARSDVVVVAAAGNRGASGNPTPFPAAYDGVLGVGAIGQDGRRLPGSQTGPYVDLVAPGDRVVTADPPAGHATRSGTSFAAAFVAGTAALIRQYHPELSAQQVSARLLASADAAPGGSGRTGGGEYGAGVLNPYRALTDHVGGARATAAAGPVLAPSTRTVAPPARQRRDRAVVLTGALLAATALVLLAAVIVPRGVRRRWRPALDPTSSDG